MIDFHKIHDVLIEKDSQGFFPIAKKVKSKKKKK